MTEHEYQTKLVESILSGESSEYAGMGLYQNNWVENAHRALAVTFPSVQKLLGEDNFRGLAKFICKTMPKTEYDWGQWGLPDTFTQQCYAFLEQQDALPGLAYVAEISKLDAAMFMCGRATDPVLDEASLALLQSHDADEVRLLLADTVCLLSSPFPLVDLYEYVQLGKGNIDVIRQQLHDVTHDNQHYLMVLRTEYKPTIRTLSAEDYMLFDQATSGLCVAELYENCLSKQLDFSAWLGNAIASRIVIGATTLN